MMRNKDLERQLFKAIADALGVYVDVREKQEQEAKRPVSSPSVQGTAGHRAAA